MVHNPIYDGPVYESVQQQFETLTAATLQAAASTNTSATVDQPCNSPACTPNTSALQDKSVRYVDSHVHKSQLRSKSFVSNGYPNPSAPRSSDETNIPRSTSVSIPATKKSAKERNKLHLTLPLGDNINNSGHSTGPQLQLAQFNQDAASEPKSGSKPCVNLADMDDNYAVMSPAGVLASSLYAGWGEISPEDTRKYKE